MYKLIKIITTSILCLLAFISILTVDVVIENIIVDNQIREFISKGKFVQQSGSFYLYEVDIDEELEVDSIEFTEKNYPESTNPGDLFIYKESQIDVIPYSAAFISYFFGGHAGMILNENITIEVNGAMGHADLNIVDTCPNNVFYGSIRRDVIGLRVRASQDDIDTAVDFAYDAIGTPYNYSFILNRKNSYYCTDLLSRAFGKEAGLSYNLDADGVAVSCNDLVISEDTYMIYYMYYNGSEKHLYYAV